MNRFPPRSLVWDRMRRRATWARFGFVSLTCNPMNYAYSILSGIVRAERMALPLPASVALLVAGGASAGGRVQPLVAITTAMSALLLADNFLFLVGRRSGWGFLGVLCRISLNPEACVMKAADRFYKKGRIL